MEHFIRIAFWTVTLSVCLVAKSIPDSRDFDITLRDLNIDLLGKVICSADATFYAPSNVEDQCITAALDCFEKELGTVAQECQDNATDLYIYQAKEFLSDVTNLTGNVPEYSNKCACEKWNETAYGDFLNKMESVVQQAIVLLKSRETS